ncbi:MAG TPA: glycosyltransferase family 39 protein [Polyangiaceae bacterium]|nr:glycosyltransferase family 39 protein [Polyangiaceae bacterium]
MNYLTVKIPLPPNRVLRAAADWFFPLLLGGFLFARTVLYSGNRQLWADEILSWFPANATFGRMLVSSADTINGAPPLYFVLAWFWTALCGKSGLALRLFSTFWTVAAVGLLSIALRRAYGRLAAAAAWLVVVTDPEFLSSSSTARFHTLIVAEVALAIVLYQRILEEPRPSRRLLLGNAGVHAAIVLTHYIGPLYSGAVFGGFVLTGLIRRQNTLRGALSVVVGWLAFVPWVPVFIRHQTLGKPKVWIPVPTRDQLVMFYTNIQAQLAPMLRPIAYVALAALLAIALFAVFGKQTALPAQAEPARRRELPLLLVAGCLLLVPVAVYWVSTRPHGTSIFRYNYFVPCALASAILAAHLASRALALSFAIPTGFVRHAATAALALLLFAWTLHTGRQLLRDVSVAALGCEQRPQDVPAAYNPRDPVVIEFIHDYLNMIYYSNDPGRYRFAVDHEVGIAEGWGSANHKILEAMGRDFPEFSGVTTTEALFHSAKRFWFLPGGWGSLWYSMRLQHNPHFVADSSAGALTHYHWVE